MKNLFLLCAEDASNKTSQIVMIVIVVLLLVALIVVPMISNKKRQKQVEELHNSISVGDTVKTVGGIVGKIVAINDVNAVDKEFVLETGLDGSKSTMVFDFNAIYQVMSKSAKAAEAKQEAAENVDAVAEDKAEEVVSTDAVVDEKTEEAVQKNEKENK